MVMRSTQAQSSLSDYKSRLNKAAGKVTGGSGVSKPGVASPEDVKTDMTMDPQPLDKPDNLIPTTTGLPSLNGA